MDRFISDGSGGSPIIDSAGNYLDTYQIINGARHYYNPSINYVNYGFGRVPIGGPTGRDLTDYAQNALTAAPTPAQYKFSFDTIGQVIFRSIGHCRLPIRTIWAKGVNESGDSTISNTQTFAGALCMPIDALEDIEVFRIWDGGNNIFNDGDVIAPAGWSPDDATLLSTSLANLRIYPGDESQLPDSLIVADKGASLTNAFRGIRYLIFIDYPIREGGIPQLSVEVRRTNPDEADTIAVEFFGGVS